VQARSSARENRRGRAAGIKFIYLGGRWL